MVCNYFYLLQYIKSRKKQFKFKKMFSIIELFKLFIVIILCIFLCLAVTIESQYYGWNNFFTLFCDNCGKSNLG